MPAALTNAPKASTTIEGRQVGALAEPADTRAKGIVPQCLPGRHGKDADVVMRTGVDTVEAKRAVHVARLPRLVQVQLASGNVISAADAVLGLARRADDRVAHLDFQR